jgi:glycerophosphoryl diester phosphodiesterase
MIGNGGYFRSANGIPTVLANDTNLKNAMLGTLLVSSSGKYPEIDTSAKTLTIYPDTLLLLRGDSGPTVYMQMSTNTLVISYADVSSSAVKILFDIGTKVARAVAYNTVPEKDEVLICSMRVSSTNALVSMSCPYWVNGKPFSMNLDNLIGYEIIKTQSSGYTNVKAVNHRGFNTAPENTLPAYKVSKQKGFVYVETDVCYTSDGVAVLLHDNTINRTARNSDGTEITEEINISDITYAQALTYDFGVYRSSEYAGTKIPTFEEFISLCKNIGLKPYIEIKAGTVAQLTDLVNLVRSYGMIDNVTWIGGRIISNFTTIYDKARLGLVVNTITQDDITFVQSLMTGKNEVFIDALYRNLTTETVGMCINANIPLEVWTANVPSDILALSHYVSGVTSDNQIVGKLLYDSEMNGS